MTALRLDIADQIATITFDMPGSTPGMIQSFTADVINASGTKIPSRVQIVTPGTTLPEVDQPRERLEPPPPPMPAAEQTDDEGDNYQ